MSITSLEIFKAHQRLSGDDDATAQLYLDAAEDAIAERIGVLLGEGGGEQSVTPSITAAVLLWAGHLYEHREVVVTGTIATVLPMSVEALIAPYRRWLAEPGE